MVKGVRRDQKEREMAIRITAEDNRVVKRLIADERGLMARLAASTPVK